VSKSVISPSAFWSIALVSLSHFFILQGFEEADPFIQPNAGNNGLGTLATFFLRNAEKVTVYPNPLD